MSSLPWFRFYHDWLTNPRVRLLSFDDRAHYVDVLCLRAAGQLGQFKGDTDMQLMFVAKALELSISHADECRHRLMRVGLIHEDWEPVGWDKRQQRSDSSTERTRRYRERKKAGESMASNDVTVVKRHSDGIEESRVDKRRVEKGARKRATKRCPDDFEITSQMVDWAANRNLSIDLQRETEKFKDHEYRSAKTDWAACWRNWMLRAQEYHDERKSRAGRSASDSQSRLAKINRNAGL